MEGGGTRALHCGQPEGSLLCSVLVLPKGCEHGGRKYEPGESFQPGADPCEVCICKVGEGRMWGWKFGVPDFMEQDHGVRMCLWARD